MSGGSCDGQGLRPVDEAIAQLLSRVPATPQVEWLPLSDALDRVLAEPAEAPAPMPAWDNSAMDGYALRAADLPATGGWLSLGGRIAAGDGAGERLGSGQAVRIFTGAPLPPGADSVVAQEQVQVEGGRIRLGPVVRGAHVRRRGEEFEAGDCLLAAGQRLQPQALGLLASLGVASVAVYRRLRVGLLSSGNELRIPGEPLLPGQIYNANRYSIGAVLRRLGCEVEDHDILADDLTTSREALSLAAAQADVLITTGGVSVGEEDHLKQAVRELGELHLWRLAIQPGKPLAFGSVEGVPWIGLPGNPAAALVTALVVARPFLLRAQGRCDVLPQPVLLSAGFDWLAANPRRQYLRARLGTGADGKSAVLLHPQQGSAMLAPACAAQGLAVIDCGQTLRQGDPLLFLPFSALLD
ncbi:MAG: gephyrin-like molybdotransferase Glp [Pseudomonas sp.]|uniref:molybdopterin molybdotransferase MoeA n=1 Tax=Pseudomonas sp. TaxID=306 RepID=UPI00339B865E